MHPLEQYDLRQAEEGSGADIGPVYSTSRLQRGNGIGDFLAVYLAGIDPYFGAESKISQETTYLRQTFIWFCK